MTLSALKFLFIKSDQFALTFFPLMMIVGLKLFLKIKLIPAETRIATSKMVQGDSAEI